VHRVNPDDALSGAGREAWADAGDSGGAGRGPEPRGYAVDHLLGAVRALPFALRRWRRLSGIKVDAPSPEAEPYVRALRRDGVVLIPDLLPPESVAAMRDAVPPHETFTESPEGDRAFMLHDAHRVSGLRPFFDHPLITDIARSYLSRDAVSLRRTVGLKTVVGDFPSFELNYHMDTWRPRLKAFFFLEEVTSRSAPMVYLRGSHRGLWRLWTEERIARLYRAGADGFATEDRDFWYLGSFWPHEVRQLRNDHGYTELECAGPAGTALVFDGRGLHHATSLRAGRRLILTNYFIHPGAHT